MLDPLLRKKIKPKWMHGKWMSDIEKIKYQDSCNFKYY